MHPRLAIVFVVSLICGATAVARGADAVPHQPVVWLASGLGPALPKGEHVDGGHLRRELVRQALLVAAREEWGWRTRDVSLGEHAVGGKDESCLDIVLVAGKHFRLDLFAGASPNQKLQGTIPVSDKTEDDISKLLETCEALSREKFPPMLLRAVGAARVVRRPPGAAAAPKEVESLLPTMTFQSQFAAVRVLHHEIAAKGESDALLGALVRAYANLGLMTEGEWNPSFKAYRARALVYAQRLCAREPKSPFALWHRAYAEALSGLGMPRRNRRFGGGGQARRFPASR